ncbi:MAG TPA: FAD-dependent monooxygenase [Steroidobacteraceae bacterium]|nr:FAD-dependent monooxygenase [Steroidobacteraceae bacterium]
MADTQALIVGAGPVGLTLAIDLGRRGVRTQLIERRNAPLRLPKMERSNPRTMEIYRRLGLSEKIRAAAYPADVPMDVFIVRSLAEPSLVHLEYPAVVKARAQIAARNDGGAPREPYQLVSQYTLEAILLAEARQTPNVTVHLGTELDSFDAGDEGLIAQLRLGDGSSENVHSRYLVGCDGGGSTVRKQLGIRLEGRSRIATVTNVFFRCDDLFEKSHVGPGRHYCFVGEGSGLGGVGGVLVVQDDRRHFALHTTAPADSDMADVIRRTTGLSVDPEILYVGEWTQHLLVAERYSAGRVFLAGDANHLYIPTGGLGMNTGIGDAIDLAWKLAGTLAGWGGPGLLASYGIERRGVALRNRDAVQWAMQGVLQWRAAFTRRVFEDSPVGRQAREDFVKLAAAGQARVYEMVGTELGYRYESPIVCQEPEPAPADEVSVYRSTTWPGARLPHVWLEDGSALLDRLGVAYTLLRLGGARADTGRIEHAFRDIGAPLDVLDVPDEPARRVYERDLVLVRPDLHVVWRGNELPVDTLRLAAIATGRRPDRSN